LSDEKLKASVDIDTGASIQKVDKLTQAFENFTNKVDRSDTTFNDLDKQLNHLFNNLTNRLTASFDRLNNTLNQVNHRTNQTSEVTKKVANSTTMSNRAIDQQIAKELRACETLEQKTAILAKHKQYLDNRNTTSLNAELKLYQKEKAALEANLEKVQRIRAEWNKSHPILSRMNNQFNRMNQSLQQMSRRYPNFSKAASSANWLKNKIDQSIISTRQLTKEAKGANNQFGILTKNFRALLSAYLGVMGIEVVLQAADTITGAENKMNYYNAQNMGDQAYNEDGSYSQALLDKTTESFDKMYASAKKVRIGFNDMMNNASKSIILAPDAFQNNIDNAIRFQEIMAEAYALGGASAAETSSSMYQMIQALGSGQLSGDELRSVREGAPLAYKAIEEFAQGVLHTEESLKELGSQGKITSDMVVAAVMQAGGKLDEAFAKTQMTFGQALTQIKSDALYIFKPVLKELTKALNSDFGQGVLRGITATLQIVAWAITGMISLLSAFFTWCGDNWYWLQFIVYAVVIALITYLTKLGATAIWTGIKMFAGFLMGLSPLYTWILIIGLVIAAIVALAGSVKGVCEYIAYIAWAVATAIIVAITCVLVYWLTGHALMMSTMALIGLAALALVLILIGCVLMFADSVADGCGMIVGTFYAAFAIIYNIVVGVINALIQIFWSNFLDPIVNLVEFFVNMWNDAFDGIGGAFKNLCGQLLASAIGLLKPFAKLLDAAFGWSASDAIESAQDAFKSWGKTEAAVTYKIKTPTIPRIAVGEAYDKGYKWGYDKGQMAVDGLSNITEKIKGLGEMVGVKELPNATNPKHSTTDAYNPDKLKDSLGNINKGVGDTAGNTGKIADAVEVNKEDMEYLRKIAEMEWKKEYTTANIVVDMKNNNTINNKGDLDSWAESLATILRQELEVVANGVYV